MTSLLPADFILPQTAVGWLADVLECPVDKLLMRRLDGATSSTLFGVALQGSETRFVLRCLTNREWLAEEPDLLERESAALKVLDVADFAAPNLVALDEKGRFCSVPSLLMTALPGQVNLTPQDFNTWLRELAAPLPKLHALSAPGLHWQYHPYVAPAEAAPPAWSSRHDNWLRAIEIARQPWPSFTPVFIHRDYHPVNVLFSGAHLSGVVDWPDACVGPADFDNAWCRLNLAFMFGASAASAFLRACRETVGSSFTYNSFWDILALIEVLPGPPEFYPPWVQFGLPLVSTTEMIRRVDEYLGEVLQLFDR